MGLGIPFARLAGATTYKAHFSSTYVEVRPTQYIALVGSTATRGERLYRAVKRLVGHPNHERLRTTLNAVLGLELRAETSAREYAELDGIDLDSVEAADEDDEIVT